MVSLRPLAALPVVGVVADGRTYRHLLYLLIAVPLWFVYSGLVSFALVFGILFSVVLVGIGVLIAAVIGSRLVAGFERWLANHLLGTDLVAADDLPDAADSGSAGATATVRAYLTAPSTWRGLGFVSLKFWVTVLAFAPLFVFASALPLVAAPVRYPYAPEFGELNGEPLVWAVDTAPEAALATGLGVVGVFVALYLTNLIAGGARLMAVALLGDDAGAAHDGSADNGERDDGVTVDREPEAEERAEVDESADPVEPDADGFEFGDDPERPGDGDDRSDRD
ncbi:MAG: sensor domain-containing protein [Methanobacteriota archaeon]